MTAYSTYTVVTTFQPGVEYVVTAAEYLDLLEQGVIFSATPGGVLPDEDRFAYIFSETPVQFDGDAAITGGLEVDNDINVGDGSTASVINMLSSYDGGQDISANTAKFDSTSRINFYMYQQAYNNSYGEPLRFHLRKRDAKSMITWKGPTSFTDWETDPNNANNLIGGDPVGNDRNWAWLGAHYEANDHNSIHGHISFETPDAANGYLQTRLEFMIFDTRNNPPTFGLDTTLIAVNQACLVQKCSGTQAFRLSGASGTQRGIEFTREVWGAQRLWKVLSNDTTLSTNGNNTGGDFEIRRYDDSNNNVDIPFTISRSSGYVKLVNRLGINLGSATPQYALEIEHASGSAPAARFRTTVTGATNLQPVVSAEIKDTQNRVYGALRTGETNNFWAVMGDGKVEWGSGSAGRDTNIYRSASGLLKTDADMHIGDQLGVGLAPTTGMLHVGGDGTKQQLYLAPSATGTATLPVIQVNLPTDTTKRALSVLVVGDSLPRYQIDGNGKTWWGDGTNRDTNLYRNAANVLKTDDKLITAIGLGVGNSASGSSLGTVVKKMEVFDASGSSLGYVPIYDAIT